jgi:hypothetical protein
MWLHGQSGVVTLSINGIVNRRKESKKERKKEWRGKE